jgi:hypothetical protein
MLSKKFATFLLFGCIAALFAAVGYWNISPERFLDKPCAGRRKRHRLLRHQRPQRAVPA